MARTKKETTKKEPLTKEVQKKRNEIVTLSTDMQIEKLEEMMKDFPKYLDKRASEFATELKEYIDDKSMSGAYVPEDVSKLPYRELVQHTFKPIIKTAGVAPLYSPAQMAVALDFFAMCIEEMNKYEVFAPQLAYFCRMLNISTNKFKEYKERSNNEQMKEICCMIDDYCSSTIDAIALSNRFDKSTVPYAMFYLKSVHGRRDNDPIVNNTIIQSNNIVSDSQLKDWEKKFITPE